MAWSTLFLSTLFMISWFLVPPLIISLLIYLAFKKKMDSRLFFGLLYVSLFVLWAVFFVSWVS